jgi:hypothetical protein
MGPHTWPDDYYEERNPLYDPNVHRECIKANQGEGAHIIGVDEDAPVFTGPECYCPDYLPSSDYYLNKIEHLGTETKRTI